MLHVLIRKRFGIVAQELPKEKNRSFTLDLEFTAPEGVTIIFGPSGSGKTTCLRAIAGVVTPDEGHISLDGRLFFESKSGVNLPVQQRRVGFVFQDYALFPHLTAEQNVVYGLRDDHGATKVRKREQVRELLALLGIEYAARQYPRELSGGESQRVALARALASDPAIMLLDEPLSAVDLKTRAVLLTEIVSTQRRTRIPFIYVTHHSGEAIEIGSHAIVIDRGKVIRQGRPTEVLSSDVEMTDSPPRRRDHRGNAEE
jgi:molybdate transport system ATP-binding protein